MACAASYEAFASCYAGAACPPSPTIVPDACATQLTAAQRDCAPPAMVDSGMPGGDAGPPAANRGPEIVTCAPGTAVDVGCGGLMLGSCTGDPILTVCDGAMVPAATCGDPGTAVLAMNDDDTGLCPGVNVMCPASGMISVRPTAYMMRAFTCDWRTRP
jgi:hypothetical protein